MNSPESRRSGKWSKLTVTLPEEWCVPFTAAIKEVAEVNVCTSGVGCDSGERTVALTSPSLPQLSLQAWAEKAYLVTAAGMFRHRDGEMFWDVPEEGVPDSYPKMAFMFSETSPDSLGPPPSSVVLSPSRLRSQLKRRG